jgi:hypothetical protein
MLLDVSGAIHEIGIAFAAGPLPIGLLSIRVGLGHAAILGLKLPLDGRDPSPGNVNCKRFSPTPAVLLVRPSGI